MSKSVMFLATCVAGIGLTGKARADIPPPLPPNKEAVTILSEVDDKAKGVKLVVPDDVFRPPFRGRGPVKDSPKSELRENGNGVDDSRPRSHFVFAGVALTLSLMFGGLWFLRHPGKSSLWALAMFLGAGVVLAVATVASANMRPLPWERVAQPTAHESKTGLPGLPTPAPATNLQRRRHFLFAGVALSLSLVFGGLWFLRQRGKGGVWGLGIFLGAGLLLAAAATVLANVAPPFLLKERPEQPPPQAPATAYEGKASVEFRHGPQPIRLILDRASYEKLRKGALKIAEPVPPPPPVE